MTALHWLGAWVGLSVPVSLVVGAALHAGGGSTPSRGHVLQPVPTTLRRRAA